jgi:DNA-binding NarL/FixJ family response regulator
VGAKRNGVSLGQVKTDEKSNEITAIPALLALLELRGCIVTKDAMGCQREIAEKIREQGADYVLAVKANPKELHEAIEDYFETKQQAGYRAVPLERWEAGKTLIKAIRKVLAGEVWLERSMTAHILTDFTRADERRRNDPEAAKIETLTEREREMIALIAEGLTTKRIAERLFIGEKTVSNHLTAIYNKLGVSSRLELAIYASRHGLAK